MAEKDLDFEWDEAKAKLNLKKHGVSFLTAAAVFSNERLERVDDREDYGEVRWIALGLVNIEVYRVVYTWRAENLVRIISAQRASKDEQEIYYREIFSQRDSGFARARPRQNPHQRSACRITGR